MKRLRQVRKWGGSNVIVLFVADMKDLQLREGDYVDISELVKEVKNGK